jgi:Tfp pilus assembly protein PilX
MRVSHSVLRAAPRRRPAAGSAGSAYIVVLLVLVVLTVLGLSLALVSQTERQIGVSEKTTQALFSSAESGISLAVTKALVLPDYRAMDLEFREPRTQVDGTPDPTLAAQSLLKRHDVTTSVMMPLLDAPCNLCQINTGGMAELPYKEINHGLVSAATRRGWTESGDEDEAAVLGRQRLSLMVELQPWTSQTEILSQTTHSNLAEDAEQLEF